MSVSACPCPRFPANQIFTVKIFPRL
jgi:hypothetical protein